MRPYGYEAGKRHRRQSEDSPCSARSDDVASDDASTNQCRDATRHARQPWELTRLERATSTMTAPSSGSTSARHRRLGWRSETPAIAYRRCGACGPRSNCAPRSGRAVGPSRFQHPFDPRRQVVPRCVSGTRAMAMLDNTRPLSSPVAAVRSRWQATASAWGSCTSDTRCFALRANERNGRRAKWTRRAHCSPECPQEHPSGGRRRQAAPRCARRCRYWLTGPGRGRTQTRSPSIYTP